MFIMESLSTITITNTIIVMTDLCNLDDVNHGHGHIYIHRDVHIVDLVKAERSNFLVVIVLDLNDHLDFSYFLSPSKDKACYLHEDEFAIIFVTFINAVGGLVASERYVDDEQNESL